MSKDAKTFHVMGVPLRSGSLIPGNEDDASAYREAGLLRRLEEEGVSAVDEGDLQIPDYLPHHSVPPFRNWPGPRIVWDIIGESLAPYLEESGSVPLLVGADCSVVVGTARTLMKAGEEVHIVYVDGDVDGAAPDPGHCNSAAFMCLWLLTQESPFYDGPLLDGSRITAIGWSDSQGSDLAGMKSYPLEEVRRVGAGEAVRRALDEIPESATILLHFDLDVLHQDEFSAAYFPHEDGLNLEETAEVVGPILRDPRLGVAEVTEYAAMRDQDGAEVSRVVEILATELGRSTSS